VLKQAFKEEKARSEQMQKQIEEFQRKQEMLQVELNEK